MPNTHQNITDLFDDIADAIREKDETTDPIVADTFPARIRAIPSGGGEIPVGTNIGDILVWDGSAWVAKQPSRLPSDYQEVEWIQSSDTQYIDTGVAVSPGIRFVLEQSSLYNEAVFKVAGSQKTISNRMHILCYGNIAASPGVLSVMFFSSASPTDADWIVTSSVNDGTKRIIDLSNGSQKVNGIEVGTQQMDNNVTGANMHLFARLTQAGTINPYVTEKIYSCRIFSNSVLVRDFVPCYHKGDNEIGLFDTVNNQFYTNAGTGTFVKGADV